MQDFEVIAIADTSPTGIAVTSSVSTVECDLGHPNEWDSKGVHQVRLKDNGDVEIYIKDVSIDKNIFTTCPNPDRNRDRHFYMKLLMVYAEGKA
jgi:hypothetical protein